MFFFTKSLFRPKPPASNALPWTPRPATARFGPSAAVTPWKCPMLRTRLSDGPPQIRVRGPLKLAMARVAGIIGGTGPLQKVTRLIRLVRARLKCSRRAQAPVAEHPPKTVDFAVCKPCAVPPKTHHLHRQQRIPSRLHMVPIGRNVAASGQPELSAAGVTSCGYGLPGRVRAFIPVKDDAQTTASCSAAFTKNPAGPMRR